MSTNWYNIVDIYTKENTANKSSLKHYHYWNIYIAHLKHYHHWNISVTFTHLLSAAHIPLEVGPRWYSSIVAAVPKLVDAAL